MKFIQLPTYDKGGPVKRGRMADEVFRCTDTAHLLEHDATTGEEKGKRITVAEARLLWNDNRRATMARQVRGPFVFVIMRSSGYARVSLWGVA